MDLVVGNCCGLVVFNGNPRKLRWQWTNTIFNRRYIFKRLFFHCHVSFRGSYPRKKKSAYRVDQNHLKFSGLCVSWRANEQWMTFLPHKWRAKGLQQVGGWVTTSFECFIKGFLLTGQRWANGSTESRIPGMYTRWIYLKWVIGSSMILLMAEILHHLRCIRPCK